jgi:transcriptional regulator with GAF, ATPase, and Fis domain
MSSVVTDRAPVQKMTSLTMAPKPRLNFLSAGAIEDHKGLFQRAMQGSLFLDEVGELDAPVQAKLLRAVDTLKFSPLGAQTEIKTDARVIAATKVDLQQAVQQSRFRDDLYFRLSGIRLHIPPLRDRREDILLLAQYFIRQKNPKATISTGLAAALLEYSFPGNVRELKSLIDKALAVAASRSSTELKRSYCKDELEEKPTSLRGIPDTSMLHETDRPVQPSVPEEEPIKGRPSKEELEAILVRCDWKILRVSKLTQWDRHTIRRWMKHYGLTAP